ncbi:gibberellin-regulated protein 12-like [Panicum virgatum]|uniref:Uncharacterized protein n=1 Tax=Panicum virgatum TaxID=38727 RepID=A0A8T0PAE7_PANVG|nr:gibberellin-regulated protein 12-like [Panicum virgatum]KAG2555604.1 hypothetical protein PVAP13_8NG002905 [Panicum virgatum]
MAKGKPMALLLMICFLFLFLFPLASAAEIIDYNGSSVKTLNNGDDIDNTTRATTMARETETACRVRGGVQAAMLQTNHKKPCFFFCNKCCAKCLCVPPGTYATRKPAPATNNWKTKKGGPKCP